jgi:hypothetical protein
MDDNDVAALVLIVIVRGLVPFLILRWPFWGLLICIAGDGFDVFALDLLHADVLDRNYHNVDKVFDTYYLAFAAWVVWRRWTDDQLARLTALSLFALRFMGVVLHEITDIRAFFFVGANIFENFYIYVAGRQELDRDYRIKNVRRLLLILLFAAVPKLLQEYVMHYRESQTWLFVRTHILRWPP